jgi:DNA-binding transcriptional MerR regulator
LLTVGQLAELSGVTIKTLHHYHRIGLVVPKQTSEAGYRLYGQIELERLQEVLFYRELDVSLTDIKKALGGGQSRIRTLELQKKLLIRKQQKLARILETIDRSISSASGGNELSNSEIFKGLSKEEWNVALKDQNQHISNEYGHKMNVESDKEDDRLNESAKEATEFLNEMAEKLRQGVPHSSPSVLKLVGNHVSYLNRTRSTNAANYLATTEFLAADSFHSKTFEGIQIGLSAYLVASAYSYGQVR